METNYERIYGRDPVSKRYSRSLPGPGTGVDYQEVEDLSNSSSMAWYSKYLSPDDMYAIMEVIEPIDEFKETAMEIVKDLGEEDAYVTEYFPATHVDPAAIDYNWDAIGKQEKYLKRALESMYKGLIHAQRTLKPILRDDDFGVLENIENDIDSIKGMLKKL